MEKNKEWENAAQLQKKQTNKVLGEKRKVQTNTYSILFLFWKTATKTIGFLCVFVGESANTEPFQCTIYSSIIDSLIPQKSSMK